MALGSLGGADQRRTGDELDSANPECVQGTFRFINISQNGHVSTANQFMFTVSCVYTDYIYIYIYMSSMNICYYLSLSLNKDLHFSIICMSILHVCLNHVHAWCLKSPEKDIGSSAPGVTDSGDLPCGC